MKKKDLLEKVEELENRIAELEKRPVYFTCPMVQPKDWIKHDDLYTPWYPTPGNDTTIPRELRPGEYRVTCTYF